MSTESGVNEDKCGAEGGKSAETIMQKREKNCSTAEGKETLCKNYALILIKQKLQLFKAKREKESEKHKASQGKVLAI